MITGCKYGPYEFVCTDDASCGQGGTCQLSDHFCSFLDTSCPSGQRYGQLGGPSGGCVRDQPDAGSPPDSRPSDAGPVCYGSAPYTVCFANAPTGNLDIEMTTTFDTVNGTVNGTPLTCATPLIGGEGYCVLAANTITISSSLRATGTKPLVLVAVASISVPMSIDVGSHRTGAMDSLGAGADPVTGCDAGASPGTGGGGAGGSFVGHGGHGGNSGVASDTGGGYGTAPGIGNVIRGGCPGQDGAGTSKGARGHGGGAVFLIAGNLIVVGGTINAGGEGGAGLGGTGAGGGGGGAGGMIGFDAPTIMVTGTLIANGGGGAEGSGNSTPGSFGSDATTTLAAHGGSGGSTAGGDGGSGSAGAAAGPGVAGLDGAGGAGGGGGGGGGAGLIKGPPASLGINVSPAAVP